MNRSCLMRRLSLVLVLLVACSPMLLFAAEDDLRVVAQLIWGTDGERPANERIKEVDRETRNKLKGVFRWQNYFEVNRRELIVPVDGMSRVRMSSKCQIEVENQGRYAIEVKLYGEGRLVLTKRQVLKPGELLVLAGDDKDDTAWFVIISLARR